MVDRSLGDADVATDYSMEDQSAIRAFCPNH